MPDAPAGGAGPGLGPIFTLDGVTPKIAPDAFIAPTAAVIGDVDDRLGDRHLVPLPGARRPATSSASARAPTSRTARSSTSIPAGWPPPSATTSRSGHNAVIHACTLKNRAFVGISATVLDGAVIEEGGMLGAGRPADARQGDRPQRAVGRRAGQAAPRDERRGAREVRPQRGGLPRAGAAVPRRAAECRLRPFR